MRLLFDSPMEKLADDFVPGAFDVICARGKEAYRHRGNRSFRATLEHHLPTYAAANSKQKKSAIVSSILSSIQAETPDGGFIRRNDKGQWCRVSVGIAREKIGQGFRDLLFTRYKSSTKAKIRRRRERLYSSTTPEDISPVPAPSVAAETSEGYHNNQQSHPLAALSFDTSPLPLADSTTSEMTLLHQYSFSFGGKAGTEEFKRKPPHISPSSPPSLHGENPPLHDSLNVATSSVAIEMPTFAQYPYQGYTSEGYYGYGYFPPPQAHCYPPKESLGGCPYDYSRASSWSGDNTLHGEHILRHNPDCHPPDARSWGD